MHLVSSNARRRSHAVGALVLARCLASAACASRHSSSMCGRSAACRISYVRAYGAVASKTLGCARARRDGERERGRRRQGVGTGEVARCHPPAAARRGGVRAATHLPREVGLKRILPCRALHRWG